ncbi:hypothetical protein [Lysobacter enzymogenes]|uniref:hypothetical protein n=1 Tax=Lysobacter enzymogenes TaxID=69 RepID=UPI00197C51B2
MLHYAAPATGAAAYRGPCDAKIAAGRVSTLAVAIGRVALGRGLARADRGIPGCVRAALDRAPVVVRRSVGPPHRAALAQRALGLIDAPARFA